jgi:hypothetical protein
MKRTAAAVYPHSTLTHRIVGAFYDVYNSLGVGAPPN